MNGFNGEIGLGIAKDRIQELHRDAALVRPVRPTVTATVAVEGTMRSLIARPFRLLVAGR